MERTREALNRLQPPHARFSVAGYNARAAALAEVQETEAEIDRLRAKLEYLRDVSLSREQSEDWRGGWISANWLAHELHAVLASRRPPSGDPGLPEDAS